MNDNKPAEDSIKVHNAGLAILAPLLPKYFQAVGLTEKHAFVSEKAAERSAQLLQYLAVGRTQFSGKALTLNKVFAGLPVDQPMPLALEMTDEELETSNLILKFVLDNWPRRSNTSLEDLRSAFLSRDGLLIERESKWVLQVYGTSFDVLLDAIPWNISVIKLPWMTKRMEVEWTTKIVTNNAQTLEMEFDWFEQTLKQRFQDYFNPEANQEDFTTLSPPDLTGQQTVYAKVVQQFQMTPEERQVLLMALAPHLRPQILDLFFTKNNVSDRVFTEFGGVPGKTHRGFLPTGETALFLLAGSDLERRLEMMPIFDEDHFFHRSNILKLLPGPPQEPILSGALMLSKEYLNHLTSGETHRPEYSSEFPAKHTTTPLSWEDLFLDPKTLTEVQEIVGWIKHRQTILEDWQLQGRLHSGYRALFYGVPGTGKSLATSLIGQETGLDVYRIDLSQILSKYIGETEKNLASIFDRADRKNWILFFDEADALFGKRAAAVDHSDRHANQEIAYLLQRMEDFPGVVILSNHSKAGIDEAFARRFQSVIHFPMPDAEMRLLIWERVFGGELGVSEDVDLREIAEHYELSGGGIVNVLRFCAVVAAEASQSVVTRRVLLKGIQREMGRGGHLTDPGGSG